MEPADSKIVMSGSEHVERLRRALNSASSEVPPTLNEVFGAALDQVADQQVKVGEALTFLIKTGSLAEAEQNIATAMSEAQRAALRAARAYADYQSANAQAVYGELTRIPANTMELVDRKKRLDDKFTRAVKLHEKDDISALDPLLQVAGEYGTWCEDAQLLIKGSQGIVASDKKRIRLQYVAIGVALLLGMISIIFNILNFIRK